MICPNCDSENRAEAKYCDQCGFPLTGAIARAAESFAKDDEITEMLEAVELEEFPQEASERDDADEDAVSDDDPTCELAPELEPALGEDGQDAGEPIDEEEPFEEDGPQVDSGECETELLPAVGDDPTIPLDDGFEAMPGAEETARIDLAGFDVEDAAFGERVAPAGFAMTGLESRDGNTMQMPRIEESAVQRGKDYIANEEKPKKHRHVGRIVLAIIATIAISAAIALFATYQMQLWGGRAIPDVVGMTEADASAMLAEDGFSVRTTHVKSDGTEGLVLVMDPTAGTRAEEGAEVVIHLAAARAIPEIVGKNQDEAASMLEEEGFENIVMEDVKSDETEDTVLSVDPEVGEHAKSTQQITLKIADPYVVPDIAGFAYDDAVAAVVDAGLAYDIAQVNTVEFAEGYIMGSEPAAGTKVPGGSLVVIQVAHARGTEIVDLTSALLAPGERFFMNGHDYEIESLDSIEYIGNDMVSFGCTARPFASILGETVYVSARHVTGTVTWTSDNQVASIS